MPGLLGDDVPQMSPQFLQQIMQQMGAQQANPMQRPIAGEQFLSGLGQLPQPDAGGMLSGQLPGGQGLEGGPQMPPGGLPFATDFSNVAPGLPNLPDEFGGFGFGQTAPQQFEPQQNLRQQLIEQLLGQMGGGPGAGGPPNIVGAI